VPILEQTIELLDQILSPFIHHDFRIGKGMQRRQDQLTKTVRLVAEFGLLRLSQPAVWIFDWSPFPSQARRSTQKNMDIMVTFPDFGRVTSYDGRPLQDDEPRTIRDGSYVVLNRLPGMASQSSSRSQPSGIDQTRPGYPLPQGDRHSRTQPPIASTAQASYEPVYAVDKPLTPDQQHRGDRYDHTPRFEKPTQASYEPVYAVDKPLTPDQQHRADRYDQTPRFEKPTRRHSDLARESMGLPVSYGSSQQKHAVYDEPGVVYNQKRDPTASGGRQRHGPIGRSASSDIPTSRLSSNF